MSAATAARFRLGRIVATPHALATLPNAEILHAIQRHHAGDWGDVCATDRAVNDLAFVEGTRLFSVYHSQTGTKFWIITEADRSVTTVLLPEDY
ncbi:MAG: hypothetical protein HZA93_18585 [Verrucomicrobia bacterium]|nr:hypothetical protein [Verrucomicrobiota bacterium]